MRVLVVDDDRIFREELSEALTDDQHTTVAAPSVAKALDALAQEEFDVVLTDLKMPRQSGLDLLREVRSKWPRTLVVVVTGYATVETALEAMKLGAFDYVRKPFRIEQVRETLRLVAQEREFDTPEGTRRDPGAEARALAEGGRYEVLFFGEGGASPGPHLHVERIDPANPYLIAERVESFVAQHPNGAVVLSGVERLVERHRLEDVVQILDRLRSRLERHGPLRVAFNPRRLTPEAAVTLGGAVSAPEIQATLEALANPIRRRVLLRLAEAPASFGAAMEAAGVDDSPKFAFHMRKLVEAGLVLHDRETYRLTTRGAAGARLVTEATFLPPAEAAANLAFPGRRPDAR